MVASNSPALEAPNADPEWTAMTHNLARLALGYRGRVGVYVKDVNTGREWSYHSDESFPTASLIKVPVLAAVFQKVADGELTLSQRIKLKRKDRAGGSGQLKWFRDGSEFTVREVLLRMMRDSDNTALNMIIRHVGLDYIQENMAKQGLVRTRIHSEGLSLRAGRVREENFTTPREMASLFDRMEKGELVDAFSSQLMLELMSQANHHSRLTKRLPPGWQIAHKTGLLRRACHDVALINTPRGTLLIAVLTGNNWNYKIAKNFISKMGQAAYGYYAGDYSLYARATVTPVQSAR
jgi:beta-lactamase class A